MLTLRSATASGVLPRKDKRHACVLGILILLSLLLKRNDLMMDWVKLELRSNHFVSEDFIYFFISILLLLLLFASWPVERRCEVNLPAPACLRIDP